MRWSRRVRRWAALVALSACIAQPFSAVRAAEITPGLHGALIENTFYSPILGRALPYRVYLPPDYDVGTRRYPVLYMLHGAGGSYTEWSDSFLPQRADDAILRGEIRPLIIVMPDGGQRQFWANWPGGPSWADYVAYDVVGLIDARFRTLPLPTGRAIGGLSMGGLGALQIAIHHPDIFGVVGAHSPSIRPAPDPQVPFVGRDFDENNPIWLVRNRPDYAARLTYWVDVGLEDGWRPNVELFRQTLLDAGIQPVWRELPGTHEDTYWTSHVPDYLRYYGGTLMADSRFPVAAGSGDPSPALTSSSPEPDGAGPFALAIGALEQAR